MADKLDAFLEEENPLLQRPELAEAQQYEQSQQQIRELPTDTPEQRQIKRRLRRSLVDPRTGTTRGERAASMVTGIFGGIEGVSDRIRRALGGQGDPMGAFQRTQALQQQLLAPAQRRLAESQAKMKREVTKPPTVLELRKDYRTNKVIEETEKLGSAMARVNQVWSKYQESGQGLNAVDQALVVTFNKMLDPGSVVRESEFARTPQGQALISRLEGALQKMGEGGVGLGKKERKQIVEVARQLYEGQLTEAKRVEEGYINEAKIYGIDPYRITFKKPEEEVTETKGKVFVDKKKKVEKELSTIRSQKEKLIKEAQEMGVSEQEINAALGIQ